MFSVEYINIPKFIAIMVIAYLMNDVFLFMKFGNDATKQLMAIMLGYIIVVRNFGLSEMNHLRTALGKRILCMRWDLCGKNLRIQMGGISARNFFLAGVLALVLAIMSNIAFILVRRLVFSVSKK